MSLPAMSFGGRDREGGLFHPQDANNKVMSGFGCRKTLLGIRRALFGL